MILKLLRNTSDLKNGQRKRLSKSTYHCRSRCTWGSPGDRRTAPAADDTWWDRFGHRCRRRDPRYHRTRPVWQRRRGASSAGEDRKEEEVSVQVSRLYCGSREGGVLLVPLPLWQTRVKWFTAFMARSASRQASGLLPLTGIRMLATSGRGGAFEGRKKGVLGVGCPMPNAPPARHPANVKIKVVRPITRTPRNPHQNYGSRPTCCAECANSCLAQKIAHTRVCKSQISVSICLYLSIYIIHI